MGIQRETKIRAFPYPVYWWTVCLINLAGLFISGYLAISHYRVYTDITYSSFCAISKAINCDTVSQSPYSIFLGVPVPMWGVIGYLSFGLLQLFSFTRNKPHIQCWYLLGFLAFIFCICSIYLALVSTFLIHSYCIMCILTYAVNFLLLFFCFLVIRRFGKERFLSALKSDFVCLRNSMKGAAFATMFLLSVAGWAMFLLPEYWETSHHQLSLDLPQGITEEGHNWIGAENPQLVITEYADYMCFQCKKMHIYLRSLVSRYPDKIRLIHRHYPMDHQFNDVLVKEPFHAGSGKLSLLAIYASIEGKFWQMNDLLYQYAGHKEALQIKEIAEKVGLEPERMAGALQSPSLRMMLARDIQDGLKKNILGTPSYEINGQIYEGQIPADIFKPLTVE